ncbi:MAG TPA: type II toxin-antitoxin system HicA family toxin [Phycisphaerae bacterium]|nr:type II toxin-antitoxin system HicA family toxin [Phycisphaerae bacterium]
MKLPREISGRDLAKLLEKYGYQITRRRGSHMRLTTTSQREHHITIPDHKCIKLGTLSRILSDIAKNLEIDKSDLIKELF